MKNEKKGCSVSRFAKGQKGEKMRLIDADKIKYTSIAHLASYPVAPSPCDTVMRAEINAMPTVEAEPVRHGYWIRKEWAEESEGLLIDNYECSACKSWVRNETNYCPNCGAKMDGERKEE